MINLLQRRRLDYLLDYLMAELPENERLPLPKDTKRKQLLLRSLMNIRAPKPVPDRFLKRQDQYLQARNQEKGIVEAEHLPGGTLVLWQGDITRLKIGAIVNAANSYLLGCFVPLHSCIDNSIHTYAGMQLRLECAQKMQERGAEELTVGQPLLTKGYNLPAEHVIHVAGPIVEKGLTAELEDQLAACYQNTLDLCAQAGIHSVAFCCISTGVFHFPGKRAAEIAVNTVSGWLSQHPGQVERVVFNVFKDEDRAFYEEALA